jgi:plastocyanin
MASRALKPTLVICIAAGLAFGIGLARPDLSPSDPSPATGTEAGIAPAGDADGPYGGAGDTAGGDTGQAAQVATITISDFDFGDPLVVAPGTTVEVVNTDGAPHTVTAEGDEFDTGQVPAGSNASFVAPTEPGTYEFFCGVHPSMTGALEVRA